MMANELPKLPYPYNALEPYIDENTMTIHHTKHHQAYIDKYVAAIRGTKYEKMDVNAVLKELNSVPENIKNAVRNHGGGHANHSFFWLVMAPKAGGTPSGKIGEAIMKTFGSFDKFKEEFAAAGMNRFGSGWAWLVVNNGKIEIMSTQNQDSPLSEGKTPVLGLDVWEHSYYIRYFNKRADYIDAWWNVVNWLQVEKNYLEAMKK
ncbi:MAG: superoxide dismutase [Candidatus Diapherotrites archaeon]|uniref:Superoxide dismutase n=1 Tax=Candidatus Iainarchaeum sp. TaxID=3101447 RepID=A0A8T4L3Z7_9ARCH|nr:superoxide dismutase [Candidatus Diapherotrites archaeon]